MENNILSYMNFDPEISGDRYQYNGKNVPRVTEILSLMYDEYISDWANSLGFRRKNYRDELDYYANIGTIVHDLCDKIMTGEITEVDYSVYPRDICNAIFNCISGFKNWWNRLNKEYNVEIVAIERPTVCEFYGGTIDVILKINGRLFVGDFKTSNHIGYKYWCQLAAYINMLKLEGYEIDGCFILQMSRTNCYAFQHIVDLALQDNIEFIGLAYQTFCGAVYTFCARLKMSRDISSIVYKDNYRLI